jgi:hypothetical protein
VLKTEGLGPAKEMKVDATCTRTWGAGQTCAVVEAAAPKRRR